jgi:hypothetical protein
MEEEDFESCFEWDMNGDCLFYVGLQILRRAVSENSKDLSKSFFVDHLTLIERVFAKGLVFGDDQIQEEINEAIDKLRKFHGIRWN